MQRGRVDSFHPPFTFLADLFYNLYFSSLFLAYFSFLQNACARARLRARAHATRDFKVLLYFTLVYMSPKLHSLFSTFP